VPMNLLTAITMLVLGILLNVVTVVCMHFSNHLRPFWSPYLLGIAVTIVPVQIFIVLASRNERLPVDIAIAVLISFVMFSSALTIQYLDPARAISRWEWVGYGITITGALWLGVAKQFAS